MTDFALPHPAERAPAKWLIPGVFLGAYAGLASLLPGWLWLCAALGCPLLLGLAWWSFGSPARWFTAFCAATLLLPPLPIDWGSTGPHPAILFAGLGLWMGLIHLRRWRIASNALTISLLLFLSLLLLSVSLALVHSGWAVAGGSLVRVMLFGVGVYAFFYFTGGPGAGHPKAPLRWAGRLYALGAAAALFACVDFYFQFPALTPHGQQFVWLPDRILRRAQGFFYEAGMLGNLCAFFLTMMALAWLRPGIRRRLVSKKTLWLGGIVFSAALLFSFSRSSLLNLLAALGAMLWLHRGRLRWKRILAIALCGVAGGLVLTTLMFPLFVESYFARLWATASSLFASPGTLLSGRLQTWRTLLDFGARHPELLLTGIGFKTLPYSDLLGEPMVADNMYLSILLETGILGFASMLLMLWFILRAGYRAAHSANEETSFFGTWIFCFWAGQLFQMLSVDVLTYWRVLPLYFVILAFAARGTAKEL